MSTTLIIACAIGAVLGLLAAFYLNATHNERGRPLIGTLPIHIWGRFRHGCNFAVGAIAGAFVGASAWTTTVDNNLGEPWLIASAIFLMVSAGLVAVNPSKFPTTFGGLTKTAVLLLGGGLLIGYGLYSHANSVALLKGIVRDQQHVLMLVILTLCGVGVMVESVVLTAYKVIQYLAVRRHNRDIDIDSGSDGDNGSEPAPKAPRKPKRLKRNHDKPAPNPAADPVDEGPLIPDHVYDSPQEGGQDTGHFGATGFAPDPEPESEPEPYWND